MVAESEAGQQGRKVWRVSNLKSETATTVVLFVVTTLSIFTLFACVTGRLSRSAV